MSQDDKEHWSDCAIYNAPAYEPGPCDCGGYSPEKDGVSVAPIPKVKIARNLTDLLDEQHRERTAMTFIERIEAATGPDRELDWEIAESLGWTREQVGGVIAHYAPESRSMKAGPPRYTASIDAALTLVPEGWMVSYLGQDWRSQLWRVQLIPIPSAHLLEAFDRNETVGWQTADSAENGSFTCSQPALALAAAAIKIKESERADNG